MADGAWIGLSGTARIGADEISPAGRRREADGTAGGRTAPAGETSGRGAWRRPAARSLGTGTGLVRGLAFLAGVSIGIPVILMGHLSTVLATAPLPLA